MFLNPTNETRRLKYVYTCLKASSRLSQYQESVEADYLPLIITIMINTLTIIVPAVPSS